MHARRKPIETISCLLRATMDGSYVQSLLDVSSFKDTPLSHLAGATLQGNKDT